jgi:peptidoglycan hydrolase-like protein with peptidoglycan-binding domain
MDSLAISQTFSLGSAGPVVKYIQEWLTLNGLPVPITSEFDQATSLAVSKFRQQRSLGTGSCVDPFVYAALVEPMVHAIAPIKAVRCLAQAVLAIAGRQLAARPLEVGGPNRGPWVRLYMNGHEPVDQRWCAGFVTFCLSHASNALEKPSPIAGSTRCDVIAKQAKTSGAFRRRFDAELELRPGNLFFVPKQGNPNEWVHVGIVRSVGSTTFETIEGTPSDVSEANRHRIVSRQREIAHCDFAVF